MNSWMNRIKKAKLRGYFTDQDKVNAEHWDTCAVGETGEKVVFLFSFNTSPLFDLGLKFATAVESDSVSEANKLYIKINELANKNKYTKARLASILN